MKQSPHRLSVAIFLIAACAISTGAWGQKVYRCGSSYSQTPCPDAVALDADDTRSKAQKAQADRAITRDVKTANTLEKTRLKEEEEARSPSVTQGGKSSTTKSKTKTDTSAPKKAKKKKEPEFFTAQAASEKKTAPSKSGN